jgi:hypothetical protein
MRLARLLLPTYYKLDTPGITVVEFLNHGDVTNRPILDNS